MLGIQPGTLHMLGKMYFLYKCKLQGCGVAQPTWWHLPTKHEALKSNPSTVKKKPKCKLLEGRTGLNSSPLTAATTVSNKHLPLIWFIFCITPRIYRFFAFLAKTRVRITGSLIQTY
jgi:hypothetical protein